MKDKAYFAKRKAGTIAPGYKFCSRCMNVLPISDFYISRSTGKPITYCIECSKAQVSSRPARLRDSRKRRSADDIDAIRKDVEHNGGKLIALKDMYKM